MIDSYHNPCLSCKYKENHDLDNNHKVFNCDYNEYWICNNTKWSISWVNASILQIVLLRAVSTPRQVLPLDRGWVISMTSGFVGTLQSFPPHPVMFLFLKSKQSLIKESQIYIYMNSNRISIENIFFLKYFLTSAPLWSCFPSDGFLRSLSLAVSLSLQALVFLFLEPLFLSPTSVSPGVLSPAFPCPFVLVLSSLVLAAHVLVFPAPIFLSQDVPAQGDRALSALFPVAPSLVLSLFSPYLSSLFPDALFPSCWENNDKC